MTPEQIKLIEDGRWQPIEKAPKVLTRILAVEDIKKATRILLDIERKK